MAEEEKHEMGFLVYVIQSEMGLDDIDLFAKCTLNEFLDAVATLPAYFEGGECTCRCECEEED